MNVAVAVLAGASLALEVPTGAVREPDDALPVIEVPGLPGTWTAARLGYRSGPLTLRAACLAAPASGWAPGVEEIVLGRASQLARGALDGEVTRFDVGQAVTMGETPKPPAQPAASGPRFEQRFTGTFQRGSDAFSVHGRHWLGFAGDPRAALACTEVCTEPAAGHACEALVSAAEAQGAWLDAPPPGRVARAVLLSAQHPREAAGALAAASIAAVALLLWRRPRPRA